VGPNQPSVYPVPVALPPEKSRIRREADHPHSSSAVVKNAWSSTPSPSIRLHGVVLLQHRDKLKTETVAVLLESFFEKLTVLQLVKKFPIFYGT
jgi:hypothetical protein